MTRAILSKHAVLHTMAQLAEEIPATFEDLFGEGDAEYTAETGAGQGVAAIAVEDLFGEDAELAPKPTSAADTNAKEGFRSSAPPSSNLYLPALPRLNPRGKGNLSLIRMPRIVGVAPTAYDPDMFDENAELQYLRQHDKAGAAESLIRFRFKRDSTGAVITDAYGRPLRESNARVIEWQDGSLTLHVGEEVFAMRKAVKEEPSSSGSASTEASNVYVFSRVQSIPREGDATSRRETVLQAEGVVGARYTIGGMATSAVVQQSVLEARAARSRALKRQRVAQIAVTEDLETAKMDAIRKADAEARQIAAMSKRAENARAKDRSRGDRYGLDGYMDGDDGLGDGLGEDDDDAINLKELKKRSKRAPVGKGKRAGGKEEDGEGGYSSQSQDDDDEDE